MVKAVGFFAKEVLNLLDAWMLGGRGGGLLNLGFEFGGLLAELPPA
jgi:hypothetical protein